MFKQKSFYKLLLSVITMLLILSAAICYAVPPIKIAIIPPIDSAKYGEPELNQIALSEMKENIISQKYDLALDSQVESAIKDINQGNPLKSLPKKEFLQLLSSKLSADVVIAVEFTRISSVVLPSLYSSNEMRNISLTSAVYIAQNDSYKTFNSRRNETSESDGFRGIKRLTKECLAEIERNTNKYLKSIVLQ